MMTDSTIAFIGLGLIGGSIARGIKRANPDTTIMAYIRTRSRLEQAKADVISYLIGVRNLKEIMIIELKGEFIV